jgi:hypothetical protein
LLIKCHSEQEVRSRVCAQQRNWEAADRDRVVTTIEGDSKSTAGRVALVIIVESEGGGILELKVGRSGQSPGGQKRDAGEEIHHSEVLYVVTT